MKRIILPIVALILSHFSNAQICSKAQLPTSLQDGLVSFYPFCGNANDGSGNSLNATLNQGALTQDRFGNANSAISLNGSSQRIEFPVNSSYNTTTFSISFWTKGNSYNIHNKVQLGVTAGALRLSLNWNETNINFSPMTCAGGYAANSNLFNSGMPLRQWNHIVYVVEGTSTKVYKNGVYVGVQNTASALTCFNTSMKLCFGGDIGGGSIEYYDGAFDDIFFYNRAVTSAEASQLYSLTSDPCSISSNVPLAPTLNYKSVGVTVAGSNGYTASANQLSFPIGLALDAAGNLYVADFYSNRIQKWAPGALTGITVAGGNGAGSAANQLNSPTAVAIDALGNIYIADQANHRIQKWAPGASSGTTVAGGNGYGFADNQIELPNGLTIDAAGNIYIVDYGNNRIQKWAPNAISGITVAGGNGAGPAANQLSDPSGVAVDASGIIYVADSRNHRIQKWLPGANFGTTVAGGNGAGSNANQLNYPVELVIDVTGNIYVSDSYNNRIQKWTPGAINGITVAGGNGTGSSANQFDGNLGIVRDASGSLYISDANNNRVQKWVSGATSGSTVAGGNGGGYLGNAANQLNSPFGLVVDANGNIFIADGANNRIQKWGPGASSGITVAGGNGTGVGANQFDVPSSVTLDATGNIYVSDFYNNRVQKWVPGANIGITVAGGNGQGAAANQLAGPVAVAIDQTGNLYIADGANNRVQKWIPGATSGTTVAGGNGKGAAANQFDYPSKVAIDLNGNIYVADYYNNRVQKWAPGATSGITVAGGNGAGTAANQFNKASGLVLDAFGNIYVSDRDNNRIQKWVPGANAGTTVAGGNGYGFSANQLYNPLDVALDASRNIYIADYLNSRIQKWSQQDTITLCVGETATALSATPDAGNTLRWYGTNATGGTASTTATIPSTTTAGIFNYYVSQVSTATGCESPRTRITVIVNSIPYNPLPAQLSSCTSVTLDAGSGFASYSWNTGATSQTITPTSSGEYRVTIRNASGCVASDTINFNITKADIIQNNSTICKGSSITLSVDSAFVAQNLNSINLLPSNLKAGLKAYYPFSGNANDVSGNNNNGTVTGATLTTDRFGNANSAYSFNGSSFIDLGNISGVGYSSSQDITMSFWINEGASGTVISKYTNLDAPNSNFFFAKATSSAQVAGNGTNSFTANNITDYRWTNYVFIASAGTNKSFIYRNGILVATGSLNANGSLSATKIMLGRLMGSPSNFYTGKIDDVFIYNRVLTAAEIAQLSNFQPKVTWSTGATTNSISVTPTATTKYFATISDGINSCVDSVTITVADFGVFDPLPSRKSLCGTSLTLDAGSGFASYLWSTGATSQTISATNSGEHIVTVTNALGCSASDTIILSIVKADILQSDQTICALSPLTLSVNSFNSSNRKIIDFDNIGLNALDITGGSAGLVSGVNGNGLSISSPTQVKTKDQTYGYGDYEVDAKTGSGIANQYLAILLPPNSWSSEAISIDSRTAGTDDVGWGVYVNGVRVAFANGAHPANSSSWYKMKIRVTPDSVKCWINTTLLYEGLNTTVPRNIGAVKLATFDRSLFDNLIYTPFQAFTSVLWSNAATTSSISINPATTTTYYAKISDGIYTCTDSVKITVANIVGFAPLQDTVKVCGDSSILDAGAGFATYNWNNGATTRTISTKTSGKYVVTVTNSSGCSVSDTSVVSIVNANILQSDTTICKGSNLTLSVLSLKSGQGALWSTGATTSSITVNPTVKTTYKVTVTDGITTCTDSIVVDVSSSELKVTDPAAVCSPEVVNLTASAITSGSASGLTYTYWNDANATQALVNPDKVSVSGTYYIVGTSSTGCTSAPTAVKVTVNPLPTATIIAPTQTTICDKSSITLTARGGTSYQWLLNGSAIVSASDSTYAASQAGSYEVNAIALGCTSKVAAPVNLTLIKAAIPKFSNSSTCIEVPVSFFNETDTTASGSVNYVWDFGDEQTSTLFNPVYTYKKSGAFVVKLTVTPKLCSSLLASITKNITVDVPPVGIKYPNVLAVKNKPTPLSARFIINGYTYLWMPSTGLNNGAIQKPIFNGSNEQLYRVRLTSPNGCITMDTVKVSVYDSSDIFVPKAFSPNKDGKNDLLQPFLVNIVTLKFFRVYNRWGQLMFQSSDSRQGWDGMYNFKPQPLETYTWIAEGIDGNGITIFRKGQTVLIR
jgi:gliding motility-associated-like protein